MDILLNKESIPFGVGEYDHLVHGVAKVLVRRGSPSEDQPYHGGKDDVAMDSGDIELVRDVFWDLFRQGFITLGRDDNNPSWPWFRLSHYGSKTLSDRSPWRFHDSHSYMSHVMREVSDIRPESIQYLEEAIATFYSDCMLATSVMLGVAAEAEFLHLLEIGIKHPVHSELFAKAHKERLIRQKIVKFSAHFNMLPKDLRDHIGDDFETHLSGVQSILRIARNEAGHVSGGKYPAREDVYVHLQLFIPFARQLSRLRAVLT